MDQRQRTRRFGLFMILCACILRFFTGEMFLTYLETGRNVRFSAYSGDFARESPAPWIPAERLPAFSAEDAALVEVDYDCSLRPELEVLMEQPLDWDLTGEEPSVLILHTHTTESYTQQDEPYVETSDYRTLDENYNMLSIGDAVAEVLEEAGIRVIHDREVHDYPSYNGAYIHSRESAEEILSRYPSVQLVLDLHRDALEKNGQQIRPLTPAGDHAQLMMVVGTNVSRQSHENWEKNLALALKLHVQLQRQVPGIMRPLNLRAQRFNQDLNPGWLLVEVGAAGNSRSEALAAARVLGSAVAALACGINEKTK